MERRAVLLQAVCLLGAGFLGVSSAAFSQTAAFGFEIRGAVEKEQTITSPWSPDLSRQTLRVKVQSPKGEFQAAWELQGVPLSEVMPEGWLKKTKPDGCDRILDLVLVCSDDQGKKSLFSQGEVYLRSGAEAVLVADRFRWILPHKHPELPEAAQAQLGWQSVATEAVGFRSSCLGCHGGPEPRPFRYPRGLVLAAGGDATDARLVDGLRSVEVHQTTGLPTISLEKAARDTMFVEDPVVMSAGKNVGSLSAYLGSETVSLSFRDDTVGLGKGFHGRHSWRGRDMAEVLLRLTKTIDPVKGYLLVTGADGYRCAFSGGEIFLGRFPGAVVLSDDEDQKPHGPGKGRYKVLSRQDYFIDRAVRSTLELRWEVLP